MVAAGHGVESYSSLRNDRSWQHSQGKRIHGSLAQFPGPAHFHNHTGVAERLAIPKTAQLEMRESNMTDSKTTSSPVFRHGTIAAILCLATFAITARGFAQGPSAPRANQSQGTQTTPLPLSGRNAQNGSVIVVEAPIAGTTTSV